MRKILRAVLFLSVICFASMSCVYAEDVDVTLSYHMEGIPTHELKVTVKGPGILRDGEAEIRDGTNVYELREDAEKIFLIEADDGSHLASVKLNGQEVTDTIEQRIVIRESTADSEIIVTFEKNEESGDPDKKEPDKEVSDKKEPNKKEPDEKKPGRQYPDEEEPDGDYGNENSVQPNNSGDEETPNTGAVKRTGAFLLGAALSAGIVCYIRYKKHEDETKK